MLFHPERARRLYRIADMLRTGELSADLISSTADMCERVFPSREKRHIKALINAGAWTDAALALLAIELPAWKLRRMTYDEGEWHCAISRARELPEWLDDAIETHHTNLATAILTAVVEGLQLPNPTQHLGGGADTALDCDSCISCDNFA